MRHSVAVFVAICIAALVVISAAPVTGTSLYVDVEVGNDSDSCSIDLPCSTMARALGAAVTNDTIVVRSGLYTGVENCHLVIAFSVSLIADGQVVFSCPTSLNAPILSMNGQISVTIKGIQFRDSRAGVAIVGTNVTSYWEDVEFYNNTGKDGAVLLKEDIYSEFVRCKFKRNWNSHGAERGAYASAVTMLTVSVPVPNIKSHIFNDTIFEQHSGAPAVALAQDFRFYSQRQLKNNDVVRLYNCSFLNNANGAFFSTVFGSDSTTVATIISIMSCSFINNTASAITEGGVYLSSIISSDADVNIVVSITKSTFEGNQCTKNSGCAVRMKYTFISIRARQTTAIDSCTFTRNSASQGGAIYLSGVSNASIKSSLFVENRAFAGGAIYQEQFSSGVIIASSNFTGNVASGIILGGGALFLNSHSVHHCRFENNTSFNSGGAILVYETATIDIDSCEFIGNSAMESHGGAILLSFVTLFDISSTVKNCKFIGNRAAIGGGAIAFDSNTVGLNFTDCVFDNNEALEGNGGALHLAESTSRIWFERCIFTSNFAALDGGAAFLDVDAGSTIVFKTATFRYNVAQFKGSWVYPENPSIIFSAFSTFSVINSTIESNCSPYQNCSSHGECSRSTGLCVCNDHFDQLDSQYGNCSKCMTNYYPNNTCTSFCESSETCHGRGTCNDHGHCECDFWVLGADCTDTRMIVVTAFIALVSTAVVVCLCAIGLALWHMAPKAFRFIRLSFRIYRSKQFQRSAIHQQLLLNEIDSFSHLTRTMMRVRERVDPYGWVIPSHQLHFKERVGSGAFGEVYRGLLRGTTEVAIKVLKVSSLLTEDENDGPVDSFLNEISLWAELKHPNVVQFIGACLEEGSICIVSEYMVNGTLASKLGKKVFLDWNKKVRLCIHIASAMADLHSRDPPVLHRDLKPQNVLLDENMVGKITDFGLSKILRETDMQSQSLVGTPYWMAPEVIRGEIYGVAADIYSFGILMFQLLVDMATPFMAGDVMRTQYQIAQHGIRPTIPQISDLISTHRFARSGGFVSRSTGTPPPSPEKGVTPVKCAQLISDYIELMQRCWSHQSDSRPPFTEVLARLQQLTI